MSSKSRAVTVALALSVALGVPATVAMSTAPDNDSQQRINQTATEADIQMLEDAANAAPATPVEPTATPTPESPAPSTGSVPSCVEEDSLSCVWVAADRHGGSGESYVTDGEGNVTYLSHEEARAMIDPSTVDPSVDPVEEREPESAPWEWSQILRDEAYHFPRCTDFHQENCVWVASEHKVQGAAESFIALGDGDVIPLNETQALAMVGG